MSLCFYVLDWLNDCVLAVKMDGCALAEKLDQGSFTASIADNAS